MNKRYFKDIDSIHDELKSLYGGMMSETRVPKFNSFDGLLDDIINNIGKAWQVYSAPMRFPALKFTFRNMI